MGCRVAMKSSRATGVMRLRSWLRSRSCPASFASSQTTKPSRSWWSNLQRALATAASTSADFAKAAAVLSFVQQLHVASYSSPDRDRREFVTALKVLGHDPGDYWKAPTKVVTTNRTRKGGRGESPEPLKGAEKQPRPAAKKASAKKATVVVTKKGGRS